MYNHQTFGYLGHITNKNQGNQMSGSVRGRPPKDPVKYAAYLAAKGLTIEDGNEEGARMSVAQVTKGADTRDGGPITINGETKYYTRTQHRVVLARMRAPGKPHEKEAREKEMFSSHEAFMRFCNV